jgi:hypothetical protein
MKHSRSNGASVAREGWESTMVYHYIRFFSARKFRMHAIISSSVSPGEVLISLLALRNVVMS